MGGLYAPCIGNDSLRPYWQKTNELIAAGGMSIVGKLGIVIPHAGQSLVLQELHEAHPGAIRMKQLARTLVWWPGIDQDIENTIKSCAECQTNQSSPTETPLLPWQ